MAQTDQPVASTNRARVSAGGDAIDHAVRLIRQVCRLSHSTNLIAETRASLRAEGIAAAVRRHDSAALFDWLITTLSYRGIADRVAADYLERHGQASWQTIENDLRRGPSCPKLKSYWHFHDCRYSKKHYTCAEPDHLAQCPLPKHWLRNGGLNQTAFSLYLFIRDVTDGDLVRWLDRRLQTAAKPAGADRLARMRMAVLAPLKEVYGVSDKVLMVALSSLFLGAPLRRAWGGGRREHDRRRHARAQLSAPHRICIGSMPAMPMARPATGPAAAPRSSRQSHSGSMRESSAVTIRRAFRASCSLRSGNTARSKAATSATAIASMIENAAAI